MHSHFGCPITDSFFFLGIVGRSSVRVLNVQFCYEGSQENSAEEGCCVGFFFVVRGFQGRPSNFKFIRHMKYWDYSFQVLHQSYTVEICYLST